MKYKFIFLSLIAIGFANSSCLEKNKLLFDNKLAWFVYNSTESASMYVNDVLGKKFCKGSYEEIKNFLQAKYNLNKKINNQQVVTGWNYLVIDGNVIYDFIKDINPANNENIGLKNYKRWDWANYQPISIVNSKYVCFYSHIQFNIIPSAHPANSQQLICQDIKSTSKLKLLQVVKEKDLVNKLIKTNYMRNLFSRAKLTNKNINSFLSLTTKLKLNNLNDPYASKWQCIKSSLDRNFANFAITKLNGDGTINLILGLTSNMHVCSAIFDPITISHIKPLIKIDSIIMLSKQST